MQSNKILPIIGGILFLMVLFIGIKSCSQDDPTKNVTLDQVPVAPAPDADSPADTIRTLTAEVSEIKNQNKALIRQNDELMRQRSNIAAEVRATVRDDLRREGKDTTSASAIATLRQQISEVKTNLENVRTEQISGTMIGLGGSGDIPLGLGLDGESSSDSQPVSIVSWVEPLGTQTDQQGKPLYTANNTGESLLHQGANAANVTVQSVATNIDEPNEPVYTIPRNATLIGSVGMTALMGRIPFDGAVEDPFPFKVIVGRDNLAANGIDIPGLEGMVFSGKATGDWVLSCVRGTVHSATFVFTDGTIRTLSSDDNSLQQLSQKQNGGGKQGNQSLGWISDTRGIPCVTGQRISNSSSYLTGQVMARTVEAATQALAYNETANAITPLGGTITTVTGDQLKFAGYNALSGGAEEISKYLAERAAQSFDVIYVDTGAKLAIHVDMEMPIDYQPTGRKTRYAANIPNDSHSAASYLD